MLWKIGYPGGCETTAFAARELKRYISLIDSSADTVLLRMNKYDWNIENLLFVGMDAAFEKDLPSLPENGNAKLDDGILIDVDGNRGVITGVNSRSVLLAVYRYLTELGCAWVRPGADGEIIPRKNLGQDKVHVCETPSYRHRSMELEGSNSYDHAADLIEWIPKIAMNGLFIPFFAPFAFYERWYCHWGNPHFEETPVTIEEAKLMVKEHVTEMKKRGLLYHAIGHGWSCQALGIDANDWNVTAQKIPEEYIPFFPLINGERGFFEGIPMATNACFSKREIRDIITDYVVEYSRDNKEIDYMHFWYADSYNSHCECDDCKDTTPSDYYVMLLNEMDEKLTKAGLDTKIVFILYFECLWAPQRERIKNPERFSMMFAPFSRTYSKAYAESDISGKVSVTPYQRNKLVMPRDVAENVAHLRMWQETYDGDSFIFDYHFFNDHFKDPGYAQITRMFFTDLKNIDKLGLNGTVNCQLTRAFFPTGLGYYLMGKVLWNKDADYDTEADVYYMAAFGADGLKVKEYLEKLSKLFDPPYLRREVPQIDERAAKRFVKIEALITDFESIDFESKLTCPNVLRSWEYLRLHAQLCRLLAKALSLKASGKYDKAVEMFGDVEAWARQNDGNLTNVLDFYQITKTLGGVVKFDEPTFSM